MPKIIDFPELGKSMICDCRRTHNYSATPANEDSWNLLEEGAWSAPSNRETCFGSRKLSRVFDP